MIRIFLFLFLFGIPIFGIAQSVEGQIEEANKLFEKNSFVEAAEIYNEILASDRFDKLGQNKIDIFYKLSECYKELKDQANQIVQLEKIIEQANPKTNIDLLRGVYKRLGNIYLMTEIDKALELSVPYEAFEKEFGNNDSYVQALHYTGGIYNFKQNPKMAGEKAIQSYQIAENPKLKYESLVYYAAAIEKENPKVADSLFQLSMLMAEEINDSLSISSCAGLYANFLLSHGKLMKASDYTIKALDWKPAGSRYDLGRKVFYGYLSEIFHALQNINRAEYYVFKAIEISEANNYKSRNGLVALLYGQVLVSQDNPIQAYEEFTKALNYSKERQINIMHLNSLAELGMLDLRNGKLNSAKERYNEAKELFDSVEKFKKEERFYKLEANLYYALDKPLLALETAKKSYKLCQDTENSNCKLTNLDVLKRCYTKLGNHEKALKYFEEYTILKDSLFQSNQNEIVFDLEAKYKRKEQDQSLALLNAENKLASQKLSRQTGIISIGGIVLALISILSFFLFRFNRKIKSQKSVIQKALSEKDVLLREIHHRVKNNLQLVSSLLTLQSRSITDETAIAAINDGKARVRSMALIHQDLYSKENLTGISVKHYIEKLGNEIFHTYNINKENIKLDLEVDDLDLDVETVVPLGLIINELITNSLKYAFPESDSGSIRIVLQEKEGKLLLQMKDDGIGLDPEAFNASSSFGNRLLNILTEQLEGKLSVSSENGTLVSIEINSYNKAA